MTDLSIDPDLVVWSVEPGARHQHPLVIVMHGRGADERDLAGLFPLLPAGFVYASLRGPHSYGTGYAWFDDTVEQPGSPRLATADAMADAVLAWARHLPWQPTTVGALGFSQGGAMSTHLLRQGRGIVSFAVNMSGFVVGGSHASDVSLVAARPPAYWGRGSVDPFFSPELVHRSETWLAAHTALTSAVYPGLGHSVSDDMLRDVSEFLRARL
ncbi:dienelactone hydrolase family protein [Protaetiibacter sp. SSC-01]|uniref:alpha/beta hydrolase n=1 Tax=Protaetiibacter sp. SSC-01 TaxID=2759943 RepID=UPI00165762FA|nr:dienelactone hydrolase family protein [Protaetiibacter sp. SSC-01]QNO37752.1 dienelactone hydrolase family protein [Protaetiibacter sp. SSC-01]